jgi:hypothetical protein
VILSGMADAKISQLTAASSLGDADLFPIDQAGVTKSIAANKTRDRLSTLTTLEITVNTSLTTLTISASHDLKDLGFPANYTVVLPSASGNTDKHLRVRVDQGATKIITVSAPITIAGDSGSRLANLALQGVTSAQNGWTANSATVSNQSVLYWKIVSNQLFIYKDSGGSNLVAQTTAGVATGKAISQQNNSGITGTVDLAAGSDETTIASQKFTFAAWIDGQPMRAMWACEEAELHCDGTNWDKVGGKSISMQCELQAATTQTLTVNTYNNLTLGTLVLDNTGLMGVTANTITLVRPGHYLIVGEVDGYTQHAGDGGQPMLGTVYHNSVPHDVARLGLDTDGIGHTTLAVRSSGCAAGDTFTLAIYLGSTGSGAIGTTEAGSDIRFSVMEILSW